DAVDLLVELVDLLGIVHGAELGTAHGAEFGLFVVVVRQGLVVHGTRGLGIEGEGKLLFPVEGVTSVAERVVTILGSGPVAGDVRRVRRDLVGDDPVLHVLFIGQAQVLLGRNVTEHGSAVPADHRGADGRSDVVIVGSNVSNERPQRVKRRAVTPLN